MTTRYGQYNPLPKNMTQTHGGKDVFKVDQWKQLDRFLILGSLNGSYYVSEKKLTELNLDAVDLCILEDWKRVLDQVVTVSETGRAAKNDPALYVLAKLGADPRQEVRTAAYSALPHVARIGTHLFHFIDFIANSDKPLRGWGRGLRRAVANWYNDKSLDSLTYQVTKYQSRDGWSHRDLLRLAHVKPQTQEHSVLFKWLTNRDGVTEFPEKLKKLEVAHKLLKSTSVDEVLTLLDEGDAVRELIPTQFLNDTRVWDKLLPSMPLQALVRNLGKLSALEMLKSFSKTEKLVREKLTNAEAVKKSRLHPMNVLVALKTYAQGHGDKGSLNWTVNQNIVAALEDTFQKSFGNVEATGKNIYVALDVSGSMGYTMSGSSMGGVSCCEAGAAIAMVFARTEPNTYVRGFAAGDNRPHRNLYNKGTAMRDLGINKNTSLSTAVKNAAMQNFGATDCSAAFNDATAQGLDVDCFIVITDSETNSNTVRPDKALKEYRHRMNKPNAKLVVIGMTANEISIADPNDPGMLDVVGMSPDVPKVVTNFIENA